MGISARDFGPRLLPSFLPSFPFPSERLSATINDGTVSFGGSSFNVERELASFSFLAEFPLSLYLFLSSVQMTRNQVRFRVINNHVIID